MNIAVVTGASSGMGREMVFQLADRFAGIDEIWAIARRESRLEELSDMVPVRVRALALDLILESDRSRYADMLGRERPRVKFLVNAAGFGKSGADRTITADDDIAMIRLNDEALAAITKITIPYMPRNSRIIEFSSAAAFMPQPGFAVYAATKSFVLSYSRALNKELADDRIAVTAVCPGTVDTDFLNIASSGKKLPFYKKLVMKTPSKVVSCAINDSIKCKEISICGFTMKVFYLLCRILPHELLMKFIP